MRKHWLVLLISLFSAFGCEDNASGGDGALPNDARKDPVVSVSLSTEPASRVFPLNTELQFKWIATLQSGQTIEQPPASLDIPPGLDPVDEAASTYRASTLGEFTVSVQLEPPLDQFRDQITFRVTDAAPKIVVEYPARGATVLSSESPVQVSGYTEGIASLRLGERDIEINDEGRFNFDFEPTWGLNTLNLIGVILDREVSASPTFLYAESYQEVDANTLTALSLPDALQGVLAQTFFDDGDHDRSNIDDIATLVEVIVEDTNLGAVIQDSGLLDEIAVRRSLGEVAGNEVTLIVEAVAEETTTVGTTVVTLDTIAGGIFFQAVLGDTEKGDAALTLQLSLNLVFEFATPGCMDPTCVIGRATGSIYPTITVASSLIEGTLFVEKQPGQPPSASLDGFTLTVGDFHFDPITDITVEAEFFGSPPFQTSLLGLFNNPQLTADFFADYIDPIINEIIGFADDIIEPALEMNAGTILVDILNELTVSDTLELDNYFDATRPSVQLNYDTELNRINFTDDGALIGFNLATSTERAITRDNLGSILRTDCLTNSPINFSPDWGSDLSFALLHDAINGLLHNLWQSGLITGPVDLGSLASDVAFLNNADLAIVLDPYAPPIIEGCLNEDGARLKLGDVFLELAGRLLNIQLDSTVYLDVELQANFRVDEEGLFLEVGELLVFDVEVIEVGPLANEDMLRGFLNEQLVTIINGLLVGRGLGPVTLPNIDLNEAIENLEAEDTLDIVPTSLESDAGYLLLKGTLD